MTFTTISSRFYDKWYVFELNFHGLNSMLVFQHHAVEYIVAILYHVISATNMVFILLSLFSTWWRNYFMGNYVIQRIQ